MKPKLLRNLVLISFAAALLSMAACKSHKRTDAQVASDIQTRLNADQAVHNKQIAVLAANGVVTLSGSVNSDTERSAVASDAASVNGVRTVVNNLTVQPADASAAQNEPPSPAVDQQPSSTANQAPAGPQWFCRATQRPATKPSAARQNGNNPDSGQQNAPFTQADAMRQQQNSPELAQNQQAPPPPAPAPYHRPAAGQNYHSGRHRTCRSHVGHARFRDRKAR